MFDLGCRPEVCDSFAEESEFKQANVSQIHHVVESVLHANFEVVALFQHVTKSTLREIVGYN